ncbi:MAG: hypothetical protein AB1349_13680 [Elusimicrobiota bacterium]
MFRRSHVKKQRFHAFFRINITDTLDAMTSDRPYRKKLPTAIAKQEFSKYAGIQFAPDVVNVLIDALDKDIII